MTTTRADVMRRALMGEAIVTYITDNPQSTKQISEHFETSPNTIYKILAALQDDDRIHQVRSRVKSAIRVDWLAGADPAPVASIKAERSSFYSPKRPVTTTWTLHNVRDELVAALFGPAGEACHG